MRDIIEITNTMRKLEFNKNEILIKEFRDVFEDNRQTVIEILSKDNSKFNANYQYNKMIKIFDKIKNYEFNNIEKYLSIGVAACVTNGDTYFVLELLLKALMTKTKIIFCTDSYMLSINSYLIELIQAVLVRNNIPAEVISIYSMRSYKDAVKAVDNIDCIVVNKDYDMYKNIEELTNIKVIYSDYGNVNVYVESDDFNEQIDRLCEDAKKENIDVFLTRTEDIQNYLENMSNNFVFHSVVVYTKRIEKCTYFFKNIKARNVYINRNPFENVDIDFSEFEFLYQKNIVY